MKINEYPLTQNISRADLFLLETVGGTKVISTEQLAHDLYDIIKMDEVPQTLPDVLTDQSYFLLYKDGKYYKIKPTDMFYEMFQAKISSFNKKNVVRYKNLGTTFTEQQSLEIKKGTFKDIFIGDYWEIPLSIGTVRAIVADINYGNEFYPTDSSPYPAYPNVILLVFLYIDSNIYFTNSDYKTYGNNSVAHFGKLIPMPEVMIELTTKMVEIFKAQMNNATLLKTKFGPLPTGFIEGYSTLYTSAYNAICTIAPSIFFDDTLDMAIPSDRTTENLRKFYRWRKNPKLRIVDLFGGLANVFPPGNIKVFFSNPYATRSLPYIQRDGRSPTADESERRAFYSFKYLDGTVSTTTGIMTFNNSECYFPTIFTLEGLDMVYPPFG